MNDQHAHAGYAAYDGYQTGSFETDPLFGTLPDGSGGYENAQAPTGQYDNTQWGTGAHQTAGYDAYATPQYDTSGQWPTVTAAPDNGYQQTQVIPGQSAEPDVTGQWDADAWNQANHANHATQATQAHQADQLNGAGGTGQFDATQFGYGTSDHTVAASFDPAAQFAGAQFETAQFDAAQFDGTQFEAAQFGYEATAQWAAPAFDTGAYDATAWNSPGTTADAPYDNSHEQYGQDGGPYEQYDLAQGAEYAAPGPEPEHAFDAEPGYEAGTGAGTDALTKAGEAGETTEAGLEGDTDTDADAPEAEQLHMAATMTTPTVTVPPRSERRYGGGPSGSRGRRRTPAKRSALLTVAVPSACVMGVAGVAAASVGGLGAGQEPQADKTTTASAADPGSVKPVAANNKLDTQLAALNADARDFGDRASRTQERIDLQARQEAEKKRREAEAARKEAERPKFVLPVSQHGLSARYGQAGVNWMSVHTGIDFPVSYGTPVMAATDGTVRTQYNSAYGNMAIVTAPDGTETWYCHLSTTKIRSGSVKAGDVIAYSGNSGNSTGPHLHFEVRPGGGAAIDPLAWLRSHGVDPT
ncbi:M23 family metallopeptidase [Streptomyces scopuliridis]|uniref:M23 family metallopeptidase n=1 Tax=Streptomyces scopuliridis TaxID=452529 RepID=A0ACD4ZIX7_9ACTN|nr:M23 family metallopeptidase [Streptomyces scopuliridis]WSB98245.1 M23 family metallopeptidase [Streptomyces scopuliridis]WSC08053.1 M23 family metallopeptidase [Streptomyces scopuliridis]